MMRQVGRAKSAPTAPAALADGIRDAIDCASVLFRPATGDSANDDNVIVQLPGSTGFAYSIEAAAKVIGRHYPEMSELQVGQAVRRLNQLVATRRALHVKATSDRAAALDGTIDTRPYMTRY